MKAEKTKSKYQYVNREAAEQAAIAERRGKYLYWGALQGVVNGAVEWLPDNYGTDYSYYRYGFFVQSGEPFFLVTHYSPVTGQKPRTTVLDEAEFKKTVDALLRFPPIDNDTRCHVSGLLALGERRITRMKS